MVLKELRHGWRILKKLAIFFKFAFRILLNLPHLQPSLFLFDLLFTSLVFSTLVNYYFWGFLQFKGDFTLRKNDLKYRNIAPLTKAVKGNKQTDTQTKSKQNKTEQNKNQWK